ncbi:MAG: diaminopimelate epimerase [Actinomycetes bacterium]
MRRWSFVKGHGTENDFVLLLDSDHRLPLGAAEVRWICDRHRGIGADGVLRVVRAEHVEDWAGDPDLWFMDYRNADGSVAEMCGNGVRVFTRYLLEDGLVSGPTVPIATRAGLKEAAVLPDGRVRAAMGPATVGAADVTVRPYGGLEQTAVRVEVGNPHAVSFLDDLAELDLHTAPGWAPAGAFPAGVNLEFVRRVAPRHLAMRVYERGVGETRSCGTGTVAVAAAAEATQPSGSGAVRYRVDVPGGTVEVELNGDQTYLTGPAVLVARGELIIPMELDGD